MQANLDVMKRIAFLNGEENQKLSKITKETSKDSRAVKALTTIATMYLPASLIAEPFYRLVHHYSVPTATSRITGHGTKRMFREKIANIITLLSVTHNLPLDMAFVTWEATLGAIGSGATSEVRQRMLSLHKSIAFKAPRQLTDQDNLQAFEENEGQLHGDYRNIVNEIFILCSEGLRSHPNIINLEAITWHYDQTSKAVWPILIFEKAEEGDLATFMNSDRGRTLGIRKRLELCQDIAIALLNIHRYSIIHGDIGPRNLLVFHEGDDVYIKMTDFGYAALMHAGDHIDMARTWPWHAPEIGSQWDFDFEDARRVDFYAFGMVCAWILLDTEYLRTKSNTASANQLADTKEYIADLRKEDSVLETVIELLDKLDSLEVEQRLELKLFFEGTLQDHPETRKLHVKGIFYDYGKRTDIGNLTFEEPPRITFQIEEIPYTAQFKVSRIWSQAIIGDFRLWDAVFAALMIQAENHPDQSCRNNAMFQLAICFELGFGCLHSTSESSRWL
ncbi:uncharacterized protein N0V89_003635 [Didymosphaeria variabile]|uniref:Protein kinase domain-containing protein n=1 Tax=Didymosphaeria variabile TaxID=1932322 RepID=A0A9W9CCF0_9PLEO|nr:uncharacterized protein N0V89_003635 [Didymosphaeria variabile]KAJ4355615.1 hypothetical protein N0V89_003635 [Didymosphaeria variabile]